MATQLNSTRIDEYQREHIIGYTFFGYILVILFPFALWGSNPGVRVLQLVIARGGFGTTRQRIGQQRTYNDKLKMTTMAHHHDDEETRR